MFDPEYIELCSWFFEEPVEDLIEGIEHFASMKQRKKNEDKKERQFVGTFGCQICDRAAGISEYEPRWRSCQNKEHEYGFYGSWREAKTKYEEKQDKIKEFYENIEKASKEDLDLDKMLEYAYFFHGYGSSRNIYSIFAEVFRLQEQVRRLEVRLKIEEYKNAV